MTTVFETSWPFKLEVLPSDWQILKTFCIGCHSIHSRATSRLSLINTYVYIFPVFDAVVLTYSNIQVPEKRLVRLPLPRWIRGASGNFFLICISFYYDGEPNAFIAVLCPEKIAYQCRSKVGLFRTEHLESRGILTTSHPCSTKEDAWPTDVFGQGLMHGLLNRGCNWHPDLLH